MSFYLHTFFSFGVLLFFCVSGVLNRLDPILYGTGFICFFTRTHIIRDRVKVRPHMRLYECAKCSQSHLFLRRQQVISTGATPLVKWGSAAWEKKS